MDEKKYGVHQLTEYYQDHVAREQFMPSAMVNKITESLPESTKEMYKSVGKKMYDQSLEDQLDKVLFRIDCALRSGLLPNELTAAEIAILKTKLGSKWYLEYNYTEKDLP